MQTKASVSLLASEAIIVPFLLQLVELSEKRPNFRLSNKTDALRVNS